MMSTNQILTKLNKTKAQPTSDQTPVANFPPAQPQPDIPLQQNAIANVLVNCLNQGNSNKNTPK